MPGECYCDGRNVSIVRNHQLVVVGLVDGKSDSRICLGIVGQFLIGSFLVVSFGVLVDLDLRRTTHHDLQVQSEICSFGVINPCRILVPSAINKNSCPSEPVGNTSTDPGPLSLAMTSS